MRSIRRSLVVSFLLLLLLTMAAVGGLTYSLTDKTLAVRERQSEQLIRDRYEEEEDQLRARRDLELLRQAQTLAGMLQSQADWGKIQSLNLTPLGSLSAAIAPNAHVQLPFWLVSGVRGPVSFELFRRISNEIQLDEGYLPHDEESPRREYHQITSERGSVWRSRSLGVENLPFESDEVAEWPLYESRFDDHILEDGTAVRRVVLKAPVARFRTVWLRNPGRSPMAPGRGVRGRSESDPNDDRARRSFMTIPAYTRSGYRVTESNLPSVYVQSAWDQAPFEKKLQALQADRIAEIRAVQRASEESLSQLRFQIGMITLGTFVTVLLGGSLLVRRSLKPLKQVSAAVSEVSEKDFLLPMDGSKLPGELRPIVERLSLTLASLRSAFDREKQATADISHELRTPLAALTTIIEVTLRKERSSPEYREALQDCREIARQLTHLVDRILMLARVDAGIDRTCRTSVDVSEVLAGCAAVARPLAEANGLKFSYARNGPIPLATDPDKLRELVLNLLHNAVEYNRPGGTVELGGHLDGRNVTVEVRDTGIGIAPEDMVQIFERFYRADPAREGTGIHAGLGLAIVREYVNRLGGRLHLDSTVGVGSCFRVELSRGDQE